MWSFAINIDIWCNYVLVKYLDLIEWFIKILLLTPVYLNEGTQCWKKKYTSMTYWL